MSSSVLLTPSVRADLLSDLLSGASQSSPCSCKKVEGGEELCKDRAGLVWGLVFGSWGHFQPLVQLPVCNRLVTVPSMSCLWGIFLREEKNDGIQGGNVTMQHCLLRICSAVTITGAFIPLAKKITK